MHSELLSQCLLLPIRIDTRRNPLISQPLFVGMSNEYKVTYSVSDSRAALTFENDSISQNVLKFFLETTFVRVLSLIIISQIYFFDFRSPYLHSEGCGRDWFHIIIKNVIFNP